MRFIVIIYSRIEMPLPREIYLRDNGKPFATATNIMSNFVSGTELANKSLQRQVQLICMGGGEYCSYRLYLLYR